MSVLYLVRHGQASFFSEDYDQLSPLGFDQAEQLGRYWVQNGVEIHEVYSGSLKRQQQTATSVGDSFRAANRPWPETQVLPELNEYLADDFMEVLRAEIVEKDSRVNQLSEAYEHAMEDVDRYRTFHRLLEAIMSYYIAGDYDSDGFESWRSFHDRVTGTLQTIRSRPGRGRHVAVFTSGGPIGVAVQSTLEAPEQQAGELNWRVYNASVTSFTFRPDRISLDQFNAIPHLVTKDMRTYR